MAPTAFTHFYYPLCTWVFDGATPALDGSCWCKGLTGAPSIVPPRPSTHTHEMLEVGARSPRALFPVPSFLLGDGAHKDWGSQWIHVKHSTCFCKRGKEQDPVTWPEKTLSSPHLPTRGWGTMARRLTRAVACFVNEVSLVLYRCGSLLSVAVFLLHWQLSSGSSDDMAPKACYIYCLVLRSLQTPVLTKLFLPFVSMLQFTKHFVDHPNNL